jgi:hypothetical protein
LWIILTFKTGSTTGKYCSKAKKKSSTDRKISRKAKRQTIGHMKGAEEANILINTLSSSGAGGQER